VETFDPVNEFERNPLENNTKQPHEAARARVGVGHFRGKSINCLRRKSCDVVAGANILRVRAETKQLPIGPAPQNLLNDRL
jgi:hypothetical protein